MHDLLALHGVTAGYGRAAVLHGLDPEVGAGELVVVLGANGVGKTTMLRAITGLLVPEDGSITFDGRDVTRLGVEDTVRAGIGLVPEPPGVFRDLTVLDNLRVGGFAAASHDVEERVEQVFARFPLLGTRATQLGGSLSGGEQRTLAIGRALMSDPRLLLVDEASTGLSPGNVRHVFELLSELPAHGVAVCLVEQNVSALDHADRLYVMEKGRVVHEARGADVADAREAVTMAYLGTTRRAS
jgi:branched-chain amino acid transport system ATP-binding protein